MPAPPQPTPRGAGPHAAGVALRAGAHPVRLKWHMLRRRPQDAPHDRANLREALARGASAEVDLRFGADGVGVCLHDETLEAETTGRGRVGDLSARELGRLRQRDARGGERDQALLFLEEVAAAAETARGRSAPRGAVQLDVKDEALDARSLAHFASVVGPGAERFTVSGEVWPVVERLVAAAPGARPGFEPLRLFRDRPPRDAAGVRALAARILAAAPGAEIVYLHTGLALHALALGEDLMARLADAGREVDCWTIDPHRTGVVDTLARLAASGCRQVTTNGPEALEALWSAHRGTSGGGAPDGKASGGA